MSKPDYDLDSENRMQWEKRMKAIGRQLTEDEARRVREELYDTTIEDAQDDRD